MLVSENLPAAIPAERKTIDFDSVSSLAYYVDHSGDGTPLLLLHSINAAPSAMEMRPLFEHYRGSRPVYAPDLPGFGASDRSPRDYTPSLYAETIRRFMEEVIGARADVIALSLTGEFVARAALDQPALFRSISLISPTGLGNRTMPGGKTADRIEAVVNAPLIGGGLWRLLTSRPSIRYFLGMSFCGDPDPEMIDYAYTTSHQPGARNAPFRFVTGSLFTADAADRLFAPISVPVLVLYDWDPNISFEKLPELASANPMWRVVRMPGTCGLPHWEQTKKTTLNLDSFWRSVDEGMNSIATDVDP